MSGISRSQVSRLCEEIDDWARTFLSRPIESDWLYLWLDDTYGKISQNGRIASVAVAAFIATAFCPQDIATVSFSQSRTARTSAQARFSAVATTW